MATPPARSGPLALGPYIAIDGHVHLHPGQDLRVLLDAAAANLARGCREGGIAADAGCLLLAESRGVDGFGRLADWRDPAGAAGWTITPTDEPISLVARRAGMVPLVVVAGRQIVTAERIEVLALGRREEYPDGKTLAATLDDLESGALLTVLPWGWGKWWFGRGRAIAALLQTRAGLPLVGRQRRPAWSGARAASSSLGAPPGHPDPPGERSARAARRRANGGPLWLHGPLCAGPSLSRPVSPRLSAIASEAATCFRRAGRTGPISVLPAADAVAQDSAPLTVRGGAAGERVPLYRVRAADRSAGPTTASFPRGQLVFQHWEERWAG